MQTTIKRKIRPSKMLKLFDMGKINIRWYEIADEKTAIINKDDKIFYNITIRHNEDEKASDLFKKANH